MAGRAPVTSADAGTGLPTTAGVRALLRSTWPQARARITGRSTIDGHPVTDVAVTPTYRHPFSAAWPGVDEGRTLQWIDPQTHLVLRSETYTTDGRLWFASTSTTVAYNAPVSPAQLRFTPPPGARRVQAPRRAHGPGRPGGPSYKRCGGQTTCRWVPGAGDSSSQAPSRGPSTA